MCLISFDVYPKKILRRQKPNLRTSYQFIENCWHKSFICIVLMILKKKKRIFLLFFNIFNKNTFFFRKIGCRFIYDNRKKLDLTRKMTQLQSCMEACSTSSHFFSILYRIYFRFLLAAFLKKIRQQIDLWRNVWCQLILPKIGISYSRA